MHKFANGVVKVLGSRKFFWFIVGLLVFQAAWLALSFSYAMLWDEYYHFGLIQFYAHHLSPFINNQPTSLDHYGNVARSPKYLYHWLMSFPLRGILLFTHNQVAEIITLRFINIALFAGALVAWRAALSRICKSKALVNFSLLVLVLLPLSSLLAAQINYDNLAFLLIGLLVYWTLRFIQAKKLEVKWLLLVAGVGLLTCVVKLAVAPVFAALVLFLIYWIIRKYGKKSPGLALKSFKSISRWGQVGLVVLVLVGLGLIAERFVGNWVRYHQLKPTCPKVLSEQRCEHFSPYQVEQNLKAWKDSAHPQLLGPLGYTKHKWLGALYKQYFTSGTRLAPGWYTVPDPLGVPYITVAVVGGLAALAFIWRGWRLAKKPEIQLALACIFLLGLSLWVTDYVEYTTYAAPLEIQGRYMLPVMPLFLIIAMMSLSMALKWRWLKASLATVTILGMLAGGGLLADIVASNPQWYWHNQTVIKVNNSANHTFHFLDWQVHHRF